MAVFCLGKACHPITARTRDPRAEWESIATAAVCWARCRGVSQAEGCCPALPGTIRDQDISQGDDLQLFDEGHEEQRC